jgi:hypothetical protein
MEEKDRIELLRWLIGRSDTMRATYSNRAALILSADAIILAAIVFLLDKNLGQATGTLKVLITIFAVLSLVLMLVSLVQAFTASITRTSSKKATGFQGPNRIFLNPSETFKSPIGDDFKVFKKVFENMSAQDFIERACGEFWVDLKLQQIRYAKLKRSVFFILTSFFSLAIALLLTLLR